MNTAQIAIIASSSVGALGVLSPLVSGFFERKANRNDEREVWRRDQRRMHYEKFVSMFTLIVFDGGQNLEIPLDAAPTLNLTRVWSSKEVRDALGDFGSAWQEDEHSEDTRQAFINVTDAMRDEFVK